MRMARRIVMGVGILLLLAAGSLTVYVKTTEQLIHCGYYWRKTGPMPSMSELAVKNRDPDKWVKGLHLEIGRIGFAVEEFAVNARAKTGFRWNEDPGGDDGVLMLRDPPLTFSLGWLFAPGAVLITIAFTIFMWERRVRRRPTFPVHLSPHGRAMD